MVSMETMSSHVMGTGSIQIPTIGVCRFLVMGWVWCNRCVQIPGNGVGVVVSLITTTTTTVCVVVPPPPPRVCVVVPPLP